MRIPIRMLFLLGCALSLYSLRNSDREIKRERERERERERKRDRRTVVAEVFFNSRKEVAAIEPEITYG